MRKEPARSCDHQSFCTGREENVSLCVTTSPTGTVVGSRMGHFHLLKQQLPAVLFWHWWEITLLRMAVSFVNLTITLVNYNNYGESFVLFLLVPEDIIITTLGSVCTSEGDGFPFSPGPRHLVLSQLCCHGNHRCRDKSTWMSIRVPGRRDPLCGE